MFLNKITSATSNTFKSLQHVKNNVGDTIYRFNYPFDYENETCKVQIYKVQPIENYEYKLIETPVANFELKEGGIDIDLANIANLTKDEPFAYRYVRKDNKTGNIIGNYADSGNLFKVENGKIQFRTNAKWPNEVVDYPEYTFVSRKGSTPRVQGASYLAYPDSQRVGVSYAGFDAENTGEIIIDKDLQKEIEGIKRTFSNKTGGNLAGLEYNLDYLAKNGYKIQFANPIAGGDNKSSHRYWNKNNFQIADDMGNAENFNSYARKLFQKGIVYVYDGTFTSEGLEGIHFQYAMRWASHNPQTYNWFKMQSIANQSIGLGVVPKNAKNLQHRVINAPVIYNESSKKVEKNPNYNPDKETLFQVYDGSLILDEQLGSLDRQIENYNKLKSGNFFDINTHDDTLINYVCEINANEYEDRLNSFIDFNKKNEKPITLNSPEGTVFIGQFSNFKIDRKTEGGFNAWDANTDMVKMNYQNSGYDEKINMSNVNPTERDYMKKMRTIGAYEVQDMTLQAGKYWTKNIKNAQTLYTAQVLKGAKSQEKITELISNGLLPKEAYLEQNKINNVLNRYYNLAPKGILTKDEVTIKALMELLLDSLEFAENTVGVLSTSYFSNRATSEETLGLSRFELMQKENPHLLNEYKDTYLKMNSLYSKEIKNFADEIIKKVDSQSSEKLLESNGEYTEYGEYVAELMASSITKYALLKSLTGDKLKTKILSNGEITYDYENIKELTSLKSLGISANSPKDEAQRLLKLIEKGVKNLKNEDIDYVAKSISARINGTSLSSFRLSEAIVKEAGLGLAWRLDAAKDLMDQDAGRNGDVAFDENWEKLIKFWKEFVNTVKRENPDSYIVAELTDIGDVMRDNLGERADCYNNMPDTGLKFKTVPDAMIKFFNETGITSEAGYSYFFTDLMMVFGPNLEDGNVDTGEGRATRFIGRLHELINTRGIDYVRNLFTFVGNHDKPRILHGLALDMKLFHGKLDIFDPYGNLNFEQNRENRIKSMVQLSNADDFDSLPLEAKLNIDNPDYFKTVSTYAISMSQLLRNAINDSLKDKATSEEIKYLKLALVDLINGNYLGAGNTVQIPSINIPELSSLENALKAILQLSGIGVSQAEMDAILKRANDPELIKQFYIQGDFDWAGNNAYIGERNQKIIETVLRGQYENVPSGESDYKKYSTYTASVAGLLRQAFLDVKGNDEHLKYEFLKGTKSFVQKFDRATVEASRAQLPYLESSKNALAKNAFGVADIKTSVEMMIDQAEYKARKDGVLKENEHFKNRNEINLSVWKNSTEPAVQKEIMMYTFLSALIGLPTIYGGDELGMSGYDEKAKNIYLQNRNPIPWSELEDGIFKEYREKIQKAINESFGIRNREGVDALNNGTVYQAITSDKDNIPAFLTQDGYGNMTVSVFNAIGINPLSRFDYFKELGINEKNKDEFFAKNNIESINKNNRYVPIQANKDIDFIELAAGISLPVGLTFINSDSRDKSIYTVQKVGEKFRIVNKSGKKISLNGITAKNGAMVLKHVSKSAKRIAFRGSSQTLNKQYNIVSNPYGKIEAPINGKKLSVVSR